MCIVKPREAVKILNMDLCDLRVQMQFKSYDLFGVILQQGRVKRIQGS